LGGGVKGWIEEGDGHAAEFVSCLFSFLLFAVSVCFVLFVVLSVCFTLGNYLIKKKRLSV